MIKKLFSRLVALSIIIIMLLSSIPTFVLADNIISVKGFTKGVSWKPVVPIKKVTFVNFDENSYIDDCAYLAAIPTAVFYDKNTGQIYSHPLLFYQAPYPITNDTQRSLDARKGINYFMEDWISYCNGKLDGMTLINVDKNKVRQWASKNITSIEGNDPYSIASKLALHDWSYSDNAVLAVINKTFNRPDSVFHGKITGTFPAYNIKHQHFEVGYPAIGIGARYHSFDIEEPAKYTVVKMSWKGGIDLDLQLYDDKLGMVDASAGDYRDPPIEITASYVHDYGNWEVGITAVPKKSYSPVKGKMERLFENYFKNSSKNDIVPLIGKKEKTADVDVLLYPGVDVTLKDPTPFGCRNVNFTLKWNNPNVELGFTVLSPSGAEIASSISKKDIISGEEEKKEGVAYVEIDTLGECQKGVNYSIGIFALNNVSQPVEYELEYSWHQKFSRFEGECLSSAANGAILASVLNAPLLYVSPSSLPDVTEKTLFKLGVKNIYLVNLGDHLSSSVKKKISEFHKIKKEYRKPIEIYSEIMKLTSKKDVIFTTIDPWNKWLVEGLKPEEETKAAFFVGPAAYIAAHHGSPVLIVDIHPRLSQAIVYPKEFWIRYASDRYTNLVSSGSMVFTGKQVYDFLEDYSFGEIDDEMETIITVAGQFDIGIPWDRVFVGAATSGRFFGSPVDVSYWISRNVFYPAMIFANPALALGGVTLINGSKSIIPKIGGRLRRPFGSNLVIIKPSQEENFKYPILCTFNTYQYKYNERGSKHWDFIYTRADGITPYFTPSPDPIDDGATDKPGAYYPDQSESEVIPFYARRAGYQPAFATNFSAITEDLSRGVIIWTDDCHGDFHRGGQIAVWDPTSPFADEPNPWRAYEFPLFRNPKNAILWFCHLFAESGKELGLPDNIISICEKISKLAQKGLIKLPIIPYRGSTEDPDVALINPNLNWLTKIPFVGELFRLIGIWGVFGFDPHIETYGLKSLIPLVGKKYWTFCDGKVTISPLSGDAAMVWKTGYEFDDAVGNIHSCGIHATSCLPAATFWHLTWIRHGSAYQIVDPWTTTDWSAVWQQMLIKRLAMGDTIGEAYEKGMRACGPEYLVNHWWWDTWENVVFFGDPDLRPFVPGTTYSDANHWDRPSSLPYSQDFNAEGHMPFGATCHPHKITPSLWAHYIWLLVVIAAIVVIVIAGFMIFRKK